MIAHQAAAGVCVLSTFGLTTFRIGSVIFGSTWVGSGSDRVGLSFLKIKLYTLGSGFLRVRLGSVQHFGPVKTSAMIGTM